MEGLLLGLSTGIYCFAFCGPLLAPWLLAEGQGPGRNVLFVMLFMGGRLLGYLAYGVLAWMAGRMFQATLPSWRLYVLGGAYIVLSVMLVVYAVRGMGRETCGTDATSFPCRERLRIRGRLLIPFVGGLVMGLNVCYPFMLAFAAAAARPTLLASAGFFLMFYLGSSVFILPLPLLGLLRRRRTLQTIGRLSAGLVGFYYLYSGIMMIIQGVVAGAPK